MHVVVSNMISGMTSPFAECMAMAEKCDVSQKDLLETVTLGLQQPSLVNREQIGKYYTIYSLSDDMLYNLDEVSYILNMHGRPGLTHRTMECVVSLIVLR